MSAVVEATCPTCRLSAYHDPHQVELLICLEDPALNTYQFSCANCGPQSVLATPDVTDLLIDCAHVRRWSKFVTALPALTWDDLIDAHYSLDAELARLLGRAA